MTKCDNNNGFCRTHFKTMYPDDDTCGAVKKSEYSNWKCFGCKKTEQGKVVSGEHRPPPGWNWYEDRPHCRDCGRGRTVYHNEKVPHGIEKTIPFLCDRCGETKKVESEKPGVCKDCFPHGYGPMQRLQEEINAGEHTVLKDAHPGKEAAIAAVKGAEKLNVKQVARRNTTFASGEDNGFIEDVDPILHQVGPFTGSSHNPVKKARESCKNCGAMDFLQNSLCEGCFDNTSGSRSEKDSMFGKEANTNFAGVPNHYHGVCSTCGHEGDVAFDKLSAYKTMSGHDPSHQIDAKPCLYGSCKDRISLMQEMGAAWRPKGPLSSYALCRYCGTRNEPMAKSCDRCKCAAKLAWGER